ncbi:hypothetical protein J1N35_042827 [Gossypium stocksii]|uniref:RNase H type-1 domain-containing protein n=1 Tax=Gossypium stocksii TaxID=47602 RepID=A0A9D3ZEU6_9ROSI|nr:hypothetical protein J1N35_042827 [Gossypium stocksii]
MKFNLARVSLDEREGCEGVLRDEKGVVSALFSEFDLNTVSNWLFAEIEDGCRHIAEIQFAVTNHKNNGMAETLAKADMLRKNFFKAACDLLLKQSG